MGFQNHKAKNDFKETIVSNTTNTKESSGRLEGSFNLRTVEHAASFPEDSESNDSISNDNDS